MLDELTPGHPQRCAGRKMRWDELGGDRIVYRPLPTSPSSEADEEERDDPMDQNEISISVGLGATAGRCRRGSTATDHAARGNADSRCVGDMNIIFDHEGDDDMALVLSIQRAPNSSEARWTQLLRIGTEVGYSVEEIISTDADLPEGWNTFDSADFRITDTSLSARLPG